MVSPDLDFRFHVKSEGSLRIVVLSIPAATKTPTAFMSNRYIRVETYKKRLTDVPDMEARLFEVLRTITFEERIAKSNLSLDAVLRELNHTMLFRLLDEQDPHQPQILPRGWCIGDSLAGKTTQLGA